MPYQDYKKRSLAIARGEYRPRPDELKVWFESVRSMAQVLSNENQELLKTILDRKPESLKELEAATGRSTQQPFPDSQDDGPLRLRHQIR